MFFFLVQQPRLPCTSVGFKLLSVVDGSNMPGSLRYLLNLINVMRVLHLNYYALALISVFNIYYLISNIYSSYHHVLVAGIKTQ